MPLEGEAKRAAQARWRAERSPGYFAWLYARRKVRFENAEVFRLVLEEVLELRNVAAIRELVEEALAGADQHEVEVGNRYDHEKDRPYYKAEEEEDPGGAEGN